MPTNDKPSGDSGGDPIIINEWGERVISTDFLVVNFEKCPDAWFAEPSAEERADGEAVRSLTEAQENPEADGEASSESNDDESWEDFARSLPKHNDEPDWDDVLRSLPESEPKPKHVPWAERVQALPEPDGTVGLKGDDLKHAKLVHEHKRHMRAKDQATLEYAEEKAAAEPAIKLTWNAERKAKPPKTWMIGGLSLAGPQLGITFGRRGLAKTFKLVGLGLSLANDREHWMGLRLARPTDQPHVVIVLGEGTAGFQERVDAWLEDNPGCSADNLVTIEQESVAMTTAAGLARFVKTLRDAGVKPCLIVFDTQGLTCAVGVDENSRTDMRAVYSNLKLLAKEFDCTVITVTHPGNDPKTWNRPAGASSQEQDADFMLNLRWTKKRGNHVIVEKVKEGELGWGWTFSLRKVADALVVDYGAPFKTDPNGDGDDHHGTPGSDADLGGLVDLAKALQIYKAIKAEDGIGQNALCEAVGWHKDEVVPLRDWLAEKGVIRTEGGGRGKPIKHYVIAPSAVLFGLGEDDDDASN